MIETCSKGFGLKVAKLRLKTLLKIKEAIMGNWRAIGAIIGQSGAIKDNQEQSGAIGSQSGAIGSNQGAIGDNQEAIGNKLGQAKKDKLGKRLREEERKKCSF